LSFTKVVGILIMLLQLDQIRFGSLFVRAVAAIRGSSSSSSSSTMRLIVPSLSTSPSSEDANATTQAAAAQEEEGKHPLLHFTVPLEVKYSI
jgi:hypothetical protein